MRAVRSPDTALARRGPSWQDGPMRRPTPHSAEPDTPESRPFWLLLGLSGGLLLILKLSAVIVRGDTLAFDRAFLLWLRQATEGEGLARDWLRRLMLDMTALGDNILLVLLILLAMGFLLAAGNRRLAGLLGAGIALGILASALLKIAFARARPDVVAHLVTVETASFPSGHAMNAAIVYLSMAALLARGQARPATRRYLLATGMALTLLIGLSRLYLGVHWPTDVLLGWIFGALWAALIVRVAARLHVRGGGG